MLRIQSMSQAHIQPKINLLLNNNNYESEIIIFIEMLFKWDLKYFFYKYKPM